MSCLNQNQRCLPIGDIGGKARNPSVSSSKASLQNVLLMHMSGCTRYRCPNTPASYELVIVRLQQSWKGADRIMSAMLTTSSD